MYAENKAEIERIGKEFERKLAERAADAREVGDEYLRALGTMIEAFHTGPAADSRLAGVDTTGELHRVEDYVAWAEQERHRVRRAMQDLV